MRRFILFAVVLFLVLPALASKSTLPEGAVFTAWESTPDPGERIAVTLEPYELEARPCNDRELEQAAGMCAAVAVVRGGTVAAVHCSVRAGHVERTCILQSEFGNPINW